MQFAHANLVIHRDLKPSNILVTPTARCGCSTSASPSCWPTMTRAHETQLTQLSGRALTPDYASPEQIHGEALTIATDVYSLGVVLYELLAGQRPYRLQIESAAQLEQAILIADPTRPSSAVEPLRLTRARHQRAAARAVAGRRPRHIVLKALAKHPRTLRDGRRVRAGP